MKKLTLTAILLYSFIVSGFSQDLDSLDLAWAVNYYLPDQEVLMSDIAVDYSNNILLLGNIANEDILLIKYSPTGQVVWEYTYTGNEVGRSHDNGRSLLIDELNNCYICGGTNDEDETYKVALIKVTESGETEWVATGDSLTNADATTRDQFGNFYMAQAFDSQDNIPTHHRVTKLSPEGEQLWVHVYLHQAAYSCSVSEIKPTPDGGVVLVGNGTTGYRANGPSILKINEDGSRGWDDLFGPSNMGAFGTVYSVDVDDDGQVYVTGKYDHGGAEHDYGAFVRNYDTMGELLWEDVYSSDLDTTMHDGNKLLRKDDNHFYLLGIDTYIVEDNLHSDLAISYYSNDGERLWFNRYDNPDSLDLNVSIWNSSLDSLGRLYVFTRIKGWTGEEYYTQMDIRVFSPEGDPLGNWRYEDLPVVYAPKGVLDRSGYPVMAGTGRPTIEQYRMDLVKYSDEELNHVAHAYYPPSNFSITAVYPNPFNNQTVIQLELPASGTINYSITDILGRTVTSLQMKAFQGRNKIVIQSDNISSGSYYFQVQGFGMSRSHKLILLK